MSEYFLKFWGENENKVMRKLGTDVGHLYTRSLPVFEKALAVARRYGCITTTKNDQDAPLSHRKTVVVYTLSYRGKIYTLEYDFGHEYSEESANYMFHDGNYSCDCNRSLFIQQEADPEFPELDCGEEIRMESFGVEFRE